MNKNTRKLWKQSLFQFLVSSLYALSVALAHTGDLSPTYWKCLNKTETRGAEGMRLSLRRTTLVMTVGAKHLQAQSTVLQLSNTFLKKWVALCGCIVSLEYLHRYWPLGSLLRIKMTKKMWLSRWKSAYKKQVNRGSREDVPQWINTPKFPCPEGTKENNRKRMQ